MPKISEDCIINKISISGFKSISSNIELKIQPLTILAGANSSGKSSFMQMLLLLKQTLDCDYDPGPLLLDGPNVKFTSIDQMFSRINGNVQDEITISIYGQKNLFYKAAFQKNKNELIVNSNSLNTHLNPSIADIIHVPGLRGNPLRVYPKSGVGPKFPGTFENYTASLIADWVENKSPKLDELCDHLEMLNLTSTVSVKRLNDTAIEVLVGRLPQSKQKKHLVSIADVGFGVSQVLPVLVALLAAKPGQLVYLEQPEIHLHPKAQHTLAKIICQAAKRGVRVVAETHSALLLLGIQTEVATEQITPSEIALHWFHRNKNGETKVQTAELDKNGAFGDWAVDFGEIEMAAESAYIDAVTSAQNRK